MRRGSTSRSHTSAGSARPCSGTSTSRSRSIPAPDGGWRSTPCQLGSEARERALVGRLDLGPQRGERRAPQPPQHLGVAPLALGAAGAQLAAHQLAGPLEPGQHRREVEPVAVAQHAPLERAVRARPAAHEPLHRVGHVVEERGREPAGRDGAERVAVQAGVLGRRPSAPRRRSRSTTARRSRAELRRATRRAARAAPRGRSSSSRVRSPTRRSTSCSASAESARVRSEIRCRSASTDSSAPGSIRSRSSSWPSSSRSRSRSSASAAARRSAFGVSPSYM